HKSQFNIIHPASGLKIYIIIKVDNLFNTSRFTRSKKIYPSDPYHANFAAPEDVIIKKMEFYKEGGSEKHLRDITGILKIYVQEFQTGSGARGFIPYVLSYAILERHGQTPFVHAGVEMLRKFKGRSVS